jgi:hypothetical protein
MQRSPCSQCHKILGTPDADYDFRVHGGLDPVDENIKLLHKGGAYWCQKFACRKCGANFERREEDKPDGRVTWVRAR